ncbi:hydrogenase iron-sulfur subunit [Candidatus Solincola tengchongensis]|uniref:hydrogenase iron-sulfur subunit n=1 Tax=Candidatus Solincola tengchongensis TaxID=2900693 RepID=UPI00257EFD74
MRIYERLGEGFREGGPDYLPSLAVFHCRWCFPDAERVRAMLPERAAEKALLVRVDCTARIEAEFVAKAFSEGYDGLLVLGCELGECHHLTGNHRALKRFALLRNMLSLLGIYPERLRLMLAPPFDEELVRASISEYVSELGELGSFRYLG